MLIPPDQNTRAELMWRAISRDVDFRRKRVIDLGCGTGDFLWRVIVAGAVKVDGVDLENRTSIGGRNIQFTQADINKRIDGTRGWPKPNSHDIAMCFSVLPYLNDPAKAVQWMANTFPLCIIEAQYEPEPYCLKDIESDTQMIPFLLDNGFNDVRPIGKTYIDYRDVFRTIWVCKK